MIFHTFLLLLSFLLHSTSGILDEEDQDRLLKLFKSTYPFKNIETAYQATTVVYRLGSNFQKHESKICDFIKEEVKGEDLTSLFYATSVKKLLKKCKFEVSEKAKELIATTISSETSDVTKLYHAFEIQKSLGTKDKSASLASILKEVNRSNVVQHSQVLKVATFIPQASANEFLQEIPGIIERADETKITRYFSEGFHALVEFLTHAFQFSEYVNEKPPIDTTTLHKFIAEVMIHKYTERIRDAFGVVSIFSAMSQSSLYAPLSVRLADLSKHLSTSNSNLEILVTDLINTPAVTGISVGVKEYKYAGGKTETVNEQMTHVSNGVYRLTLPTLPPIGMVDFVLDVGAESKYIPTQVTVSNMMVTSLNVDKLSFSIRDKGQTKSTLDETVTYPGQLSTQPSADQHQIIVVKLSVTDSEGKRYNPHQVFVCFVESETDNEVFFIGQPSTSGDEHYVIDIDLGAVVKESFRSISGQYDFSMLIGDHFGSNAIKWDLGSVIFTFPPKPPGPKPDIMYGMLPEIHHEFKKPEPRPPAIVSNIFCAIVLSPWLILLVMWPKVGANIRNLFSFGLSGIVFQISLISIGVLYFLYWWQLNMFQTLFYLSGLSVIAFFSGHRTLRTRAANRMKK